MSRSTRTLGRRRWWSGWNRVQLPQVVLGPVVNVHDDIPDVGRIRVEASDVGVMAQLRVADTGTGMDKETCRPVFEPFLTTKPHGRGAGLGLATVYGIVSKAGREIDVASSPGNQTTMRVQLPLPVGAGPGSIPQASPSPGEALKLVLVVDDEAALRLSISRFLERRGYRVHVAGDGLEALAVLTALDWRVDLVLTDIVMPRLGGIELSERIVSRSNPPAVLCMTGHAGRGSESPVDAPWHPDQVLVKPFELGQLVERIAATLAVSGG